MKFTDTIYLLAIVALLSIRTSEAEKTIRNNEGAADEVPRVKIKVFRSPLKEQDGEQYATWGFWVKQPVRNA